MRLVALQGCTREVLTWLWSTLCSGAIIHSTLTSPIQVLGSVNNCPTQLRQRFNDSRRQTLFWWGNDSPRIGQILGKLHETARKRDVCYVCPVICIAIYCKTQREPIAFQTRGRGGQQLPGYPTWNVTVQLPCDYWSQAKLHHQPL